MDFAAKHLPDSFYLEGTQRISIRDHIFREVITNLLIHREFLNPFPAKLVIEKGLVRTENANRPHGHGLIDPASFSPFPKNPIIARFFKEIGWADKLGPGVRKLFRYCRDYGGENPELVENDIFRFILPLPNLELTGETPVETPVETSKKILHTLKRNPQLTLAEVAEKIGKSLSAVERASTKLVNDGRLKRAGPQKGGHWEVSE